jgi:hypothetical protein
MPLRLASLLALAAGPAALALLPVLGWLADHGSNPKRRKTQMIVTGSLILLCGLTMIVVANFMHLSYLDEFLALRNDGNGSNVMDDAIFDWTLLGNGTSAMNTTLSPSLNFTLIDDLDRPVWHNFDFLTRNTCLKQ